MKLGVVTLLALAACEPDVTTVPIDAPADVPVDVPVDMPTGPGPWSAPTQLAITAAGDDDPTATGDLLELYFNRAGDIYVSRRTAVSDPWGAPAVVAELSSASSETTPEVSYDGLTMYFASTRAGGLGGNDLWRSTRPNRTSPWGMPVVVTELNSTSAEGAATSPDGLLMVLDSNRLSATNLDVFMTQRASPSDPWGTPTPLPELNTGSNDDGPMLSADKLELYFDSDRIGEGELFVSRRTRTDAPFGPPEQLVELGSASSETDAWISPDGRTMYFTSSRDGAANKLWQTTR